jgi:hypothetical protein
MFLERLVQAINELFAKFWLIVIVRADPNLTHPADPILTRGWSLTA